MKPECSVSERIAQPRTGWKLLRHAALLLLMLLIALPSHAQSSKDQQSGKSIFTDTIVGKWIWFTGTVVTLKADGTVTDNNGSHGKWVCSDQANKLYVIHWGRGKWQDSLKLVNGDKKLIGKNQKGHEVTANRAKEG